MKKGFKKVTADEIADMADNGKDVSQFFTNEFEIKPPEKQKTQRVNVDFTFDMLQELDKLAAELNISRQAVIKSYLRHALDQHCMAVKKVM